MISRALAVALAVSVAGHALQWWRLDAAEDALVRVTAQASADALAAETKARETEQSYAYQIERAQKTRESEQVASRRAADRLRTERDGLRNDIASYAAGPSDDTRAACGERASTLGALLDDALRTAAACAAGAEQHASDVRALRDGWPSVK